MPSRAKQNFSHEAKSQAEVFLHVVNHSISTFVNQSWKNCTKIHHMSFNHTTSYWSRKTLSIRQKFPMPGITRNYYGFLAWNITQNSWKFFNCGTKFSNSEALIPSSLVVVKLVLVLKLKLWTHLLISRMVEWEEFWLLPIGDFSLWLLCLANLDVEICL